MTDAETIQKLKEKVQILSDALQELINDTEALQEILEQASYIYTAQNLRENRKRAQDTLNSL
jgi:predicted RNase H-like nuclease (RuvC/YqgF family)